MAGTNCRKTCPTHRGLRLSEVGLVSIQDRSEDLPHSSGIKTLARSYKTLFKHSRKTCPTHRGLRLQFGTGFNKIHLSEDLPHSSGIKTQRLNGLAVSSCRKTCPTHRGLRLKRLAFLFNSFGSEDLPHSSGIKTHQNVIFRQHLHLERLAPLIGDKYQTALMVCSIKAVFCIGYFFQAT